MCLNRPILHIQHVIFCHIAVITERKINKSKDNGFTQELFDNTFCLKGELLRQLQQGLVLYCAIYDWFKSFHHMAHPMSVVVNCLPRLPMYVLHVPQVISGFDSMRELTVINLINLQKSSPLISNCNSIIVNWLKEFEPCQCQVIYWTMSRIT